MAYSTVTLTGRRTSPSGRPHRGYVTVEPSVSKIIDGDGNVVLSGRSRVDLVSEADATEATPAGSFSIVLPATDDASLNPTGFTYLVRVVLHDGPDDSLTIDLPAAVPVVDLADKTEADPSAPTYTERVNEATEAAAAAGESATLAASSATTASTAATTAQAAASEAETSAGEATTAAGQAAASAAGIAKGEPGGVAPLDATGKLPDVNVPERLSEESLATAFVTYGPGLSEAAQPLFIAHRGAGARQYPEYALEGIRAAVAAGLQAVELDTWVLADGAVGIHHDATLDRATTATGNVEDQSAVSWQNVKVDGDLVGGAWAGKTYANPLFEDVLREFGNKVILVPEVRAGSAAVIKAALEKYQISKEHVLIQAFSTTELLPFIADGYHTMKLGDNPDVPAAVAAGIEYVAVPSNSTFDVTTITAAGLKSGVYLVDKHVDRDAWMAKGVTAFFSDDPVYASGRHAIRTTDPYASQTWYHGDGMSSSKRGVFVAPDGWGFAADASNGFFGAEQGWASPIDTPEFMGVRFSFKWDSANLDTSYISVFFGVTDKQFNNTANPVNGYHFIMRRNGSFVIYRFDNGAATALGAGTSTAIANGTTTTWRITRTLTGAWSTEREDVAATLTRTDTTYPLCPYLFFGESGVAGHFRNVDTNAI